MADAAMPADARAALEAAGALPYFRVNGSCLVCDLNGHSVPLANVGALRQLLGCGAAARAAADAGGAAGTVAARTAAPWLGRCQ